MAESVTIRQVTTAADIAAVRGLCWDYRDFLLNLSSTHRDITETFYPFEKYQKLMDGLEAEHTRPTGMILLAEMNDMPVGCGMTHAMDAQTSEIKRVFVAQAARGKRIADRLCRALMEQARADGFKKIVLDTASDLTSARRLYERLGFTSCPPYQPIPAHVLPHLVFYQATL